MNRVQEIDVYVSYQHCEYSRELLALIDELCNETEKKSITVTEVTAMVDIPAHVEDVPTLVVNKDVNYGKKVGQQCFSFIKALYSSTRREPTPEEVDAVTPLSKKPKTGGFTKIGKDKRGENEALERIAAQLERTHNNEKGSCDVDLEKMMAARKSAG